MFGFLSLIIKLYTIKDTLTPYFNKVKKLDFECIFICVVVILEIIFISIGIIYLWNIGPGFYGAKLLN
jgi:hypothetical protein